jgi:hypothetical protein
MVIVRTDEEIDALEVWAAEGQDRGTHFSGMSYEDGIWYVLDWLRNPDAEFPGEE